MTLIEHVGLYASIALPLSNIPLILKIVKRKSASDISMGWVWMVWGCSILMVPSGLMSADIAFKVFNIVNITLFTGVVIVVLKYRKKS